MKILIASPSFPVLKKGVYDGRFVFSEAVAYARAGAEVRVVAPHFPGTDVVEKVYQNVVTYRFVYFYPKSLQRLRVPGVPIYRTKSFFSLLQIPFFCIFFSLAILKHATWADIIHVQWTLTALLALPAKWLYKKKIVLTARGTDIRNFPKWLNRAIHYQVDAAIDCFGPQPRNRLYRRTFSARFLKLPLVAHIEECKSIPKDMADKIRGREDVFKLMYVGRFDEFKIKHSKLPILDLVKAARILKYKNADFHVFYIGGGDEKIYRNVNKLVKSLEVADRVSLLGNKMNATDYMRFANVGLGGVAFNAVSQEFTLLEKPQMLVMVSDNFETPWQHMRNAIFIRPNDPADIAEKILWAIEHKEQVKEIGVNARNTMRQYISDSFSAGQIYLSAFATLLNHSRN